MGGKHIVLEIEDYELHEWSECELRGYLCGGISVITPLPAGEGTREGPAGEGGGASCCLLRASWLYAFLAVLSLLFIIYTQWERLQQDRVDLRCCSLIILFVCCSFTLLTIYSCCYHFIGLPFSSFLDSEATLTSKSAVVFTHLVITLLGCLFHPFLIVRQP